MILLPIAVVITGCASAPPIGLKESELPKSWSESVTTQVGEWPDSDWWRNFASPELNTLISEARTTNLDLAAATARVLQADAAAKIAGAALLPSVGLGAGAQVQGATDNGSTISSRAFGITGLASYELDFWGLARSNLRAAKATLYSVRYARETVALTVTANVGATYLDVLATRQRIDIAQQNLETARRLLTAIERMVEAGLASPLDLAQQKTLIAGQEAELPTLQQRERESRYALALLLGRAPEAFSVAAESLDGISVPSIVPGMPAELLYRRPDIAQAEAELIAAHANVDAARAAYFPSIVLTASGGLASGATSAVAAGPAVGEIIAEAGSTGLIYGLGASLLQTIFDGGRIEGQRDLALAQEQELIANYRSAVFSAFSDVESALSRAASLEEQERFKTRQVKSAAAAFDISEKQYRQGLVGLLALLQTQQTFFEAQDQLTEIKRARIQALVDLYKALGGGWSATQPMSVVERE